jgi:hypothetical protein
MSKKASRSIIIPLKPNKIVFVSEPASKKARTTPQAEKSRRESKEQTVLTKKRVNEKIFIENSFFDLEESKVENVVSFIKNSLKNTFPLLRKRRGCQKGALMYSDQDKQHLLK